MFEVIDSDNERVYVIKCRNISSDLHFFEENVDHFIKFDHRNMVLDLKEQEVINSLLLSVLIRIRNGLSVERRDLRLKNCNYYLYKCIELAGLASYFSF